MGIAPGTKFTFNTGRMWAWMAGADGEPFPAGLCVYGNKDYSVVYRKGATLRCRNCGAEIKNTEKYYGHDGTDGLCMACGDAAAVVTALEFSD